MVAAHQHFFESGKPLEAHASGFVGEWVLDRVSGLVDVASDTIHRLLIDEGALHVELPGSASESFVLRVAFDGTLIDSRRDGEGYCMQALLEADTLVWELELHDPQRGCARVRRVMRPSKQGSQLIAERVDLNADGGPIGLRTEYWTRAGKRPATSDITFA